MTPGLFDDDPAPPPQKLAPLVPPGDDVAVPRAVLAALKLTLVRIRNYGTGFGERPALPAWLLVECGATVQLIDGVTQDRKEAHEPPPTSRPHR